MVAPHYAKAGKGRRPVGLRIMLRVYLVQQWFNLSDPGVEEALYESAALRRFVGVDLGVAPAPDETTICRFRHLLEQHALGELMLEAVNVHLEAKGIRIATGTIADATREGKQWCFGLKAHRAPRGIRDEHTLTHFANMLRLTQCPGSDFRSWTWFSPPATKQAQTASDSAARATCKCAFVPGPKLSNKLVNV